MKLQKQTVPIPITDLGIDAGGSPQLSSNFTKLENIHITRRGSVGKRTGRVRTANTTVQDSISARQMASLDGVPILIGNGGLASVRGTTVAKLEEYKYGVDDDLIGSLSATRIYGRPGKHTDTAATASYGVCVTSQEDLYGSYGYGHVFSFDLSTGAIISSVELIDMAGSEARIRCLAVGTSVHCYYVALDGANRKISHFSFDSSGVYVADGLTTLTLGATSADCIFDACLTGTTVAIVYRNAAGDIAIARLPSGVLDATDNVVTTGTYAPSVAVYERSSGIVDVVYVQDSGGTSWELLVESWDMSARAQEYTAVSVSTWTKATYSPTEPTAISGVNRVRSGSGCTLMISARRAAYYGEIREYAITVSGGGLSSALQRTLGMACLATKLAASGANSFICGVYTRSWLDIADETVSDCFVWITAGRSWYRPVAKAALGKAKQDWGLTTGVKANTDQLCSLITDSSGRFISLLRVVVAKPPSNRYYLATGVYSQRSALMRYMLDFSSNDLQHVEDGGLLHLAGAMPRVTDGSYVFEQGFLQSPGKCAMITAPGSGSNFKYLATYEHVDAKGNRHQSVPSIIPVEHTGTDGATVQVLVPSLTLTARQGTTIVLWRSIENGPYFRVATAENVPSSSYVTITESIPFATAEAQEQLYTTGNVLEYDHPPAYNAAEAYDQRLWIAPVEDRGARVMFGPRRIDYRPHSFNEVLQLAVDERGGAITGMKRAGDRLLISKSTRTLATWGGPGPDDIGSGPNYQAPFDVSPSVGCTRARSMAESDGGVLFEATDGIWRCSSQGQIEPVGDRARYYADAVTLAQAAADTTREIVIVQSATAASLVWNWLRSAWATWTGYSGLASVPSSAGIVTLAADRHVWVDDATRYDDNGAHVPLLIETGWIPIGQLAGYGHLIDVQLIGQFLSACSLRVQWQFNNNPVWTSAYDINLGSALLPSGVADHYGAGLASPTYDDEAMILSVRPPRSKVTSFRLRVTDVDTLSVNTQAFELCGLSVTIALRPGRYPVDSDRRIA